MLPRKLSKLKFGWGGGKMRKDMKKEKKQVTMPPGKQLALSLSLSLLSIIPSHFPLSLHFPFFLISFLSILFSSFFYHSFYPFFFLLSPFPSLSLYFLLLSTFSSSSYFPSFCSFAFVFMSTFSSFNVPFFFFFVFFLLTLLFPHVFTSFSSHFFFLLSLILSTFLSFFYSPFSFLLFSLLSTRPSLSSHVRFFLFTFLFPPTFPLLSIRSSFCFTFFLLTILLPTPPSSFYLPSLTFYFPLPSNFSFSASWAKISVVVAQSQHSPTVFAREQQERTERRLANEGVWVIRQVRTSKDGWTLVNG